MRARSVAGRVGQRHRPPAARGLLGGRPCRRRGGRDAAAGVGPPRVQPLRRGAGGRRERSVSAMCRLAPVVGDSGGGCAGLKVEPLHPVFGASALPLGPPSPAEDRLTTRRHHLQPHSIGGGSSSAGSSVASASHRRTGCSASTPWRGQHSSAAREIDLVFRVAASVHGLGGRAMIPYRGAQSRCGVRRPPMSPAPARLTFAVFPLWEHCCLAVRGWTGRAAKCYRWEPPLWWRTCQAIGGAGKWRQVKAAPRP